MKENLDGKIVRVEWKDRLFFPELRDYVDNVIKRYALLTSVFSTGLGIVSGNPDLRYIGSSVYHAQMEV